MQLKKIYLTCLSVILLAFSSLSLALDARVDRTSVPENESFQLVLTGSFSAFNLSIDLAALEKDFQVLDNRRSTNMQYINGDFTAQTTLTVTLEPKQPGVYTIPSITIEDESSQPIQIQVTKANSIQTGPNEVSPIDITVELDQTDTWVQAQMLLTIKLYQSVKLYNAELNGIKELQAQGLSLEKIGDNKSYQSKRNNQTYQVTELNYVVFADNPGSFELPTFSFQGQLPARSYGSRYGKSIRVSADPISINIKDVPKDYPSATWIPAKRLELSDDLNDTIEVSVGESINRNLVVSVAGQEAAVIPDFPEIKSPLLNAYSDAPELNNQINMDGITGVRMDSVALITKAPGTLTLPELSITWFNTTTGKVETTVLPQRTLNIIGAANQPSAPQPLTVDPVEIKTEEPSEPTTEIKTEIKETASTWLVVMTIVLGVIVFAQAIIIWILLQRAKHPKTIDEENLTTQNNSAHDWNHPLPADFVACHRIINHELKNHNMSASALTDEIQQLLNDFRASTYRPNSQKTFTETERVTLNNKLAAFFTSLEGQKSDAPSLYPS